MPKGNSTVAPWRSRGVLAEDVISVRNQGTAAGQIGFSEGQLTYGGTVIGTLSGGHGEALNIIFNAAATSAAIDALIQNLTYGNVSDTPTANRTLVLNVTDAAGEDLGLHVPASFALLPGDASPVGGVNGGLRITPTFVDLDGDGDMDLVAGVTDGQLRVWANAAGVYTSQTGAANPFDGINMGTASAPNFVDLDGDGDLDLVVGVFNGALLSFENTTPHGQPIVVTVTAETDRFTGTAGNDTLSGTTGPDLISGLGGNDTLVGGAGADTVYGGAGNDRLLGGPGGGAVFWGRQ